MLNFANMIGCIHTEVECTILIEQAFYHRIKKVSRKLCDKEKKTIASGHIFVYVEEECGIRRWTDNKHWTASRVSGPFMVYIEKFKHTPLLKRTYSTIYRGLNYHIVSYINFDHDYTRMCCNIFDKKDFFSDYVISLSRQIKKKRNLRCKTDESNILKYSRGFSHNGPDYFDDEICVQEIKENEFDFDDN